MVVTGKLHGEITRETVWAFDQDAHVVGGDRSQHGTETRAVGDWVGTTHSGVVVPADPLWSWALADFRWRPAADARCPVGP
jgi:hypothetical protein